MPQAAGRNHDFNAAGGGKEENMYQIRKMQSRQEIDSCELFHINHYMWNSKRRPAVSGKMGYIPGEGFYVRMVCEEEKPLTTYTNYMDPVCNDSAMEVFLAFPEEGERLGNNVMYLNFEANSNGTLYAAYGKGRKGRSPMPADYLPLCDMQAEVGNESWSLAFLIPEAYLKKECGVKELNENTEMYCNFYKISETPEIEHYGSFHLIENPTPNFHLPLYFERCQIG